MTKTETDCVHAMHHVEAMANLAPLSADHPTSYCAEGLLAKLDAVACQMTPNTTHMRLAPLLLPHIYAG